MLFVYGFDLAVQHQHVLNSTEKCTALPPDIPDLRTPTQFPVDHGTEVTVTCDSSELRGDSVITCIDSTLFNFDEKPKCNIEGTRFAFHF